MIGFRVLLSLFLLSVFISTSIVLAYLALLFLKGGLDRDSFSISGLMFVFVFIVSYLALLLAVMFGGDKNG
ncbi:MAG: hypothetical protein CMH91_02790 [Oceanicaulis sp.]|nr:hypothetical protein [Oceanicaulis sp.]MBG35594.1 hypothetical protein [Oceanicaulis sp.]HBU63532.1 hypothetical protein [Oceanicaulis sp.]HCR95510.1 hypothetical protein [Oceanicaulis sp.]|tara:strand:- start:391 stop:603 length:213 start_codon:yes stop_codon:yes gene_type:complete